MSLLTWTYPASARLGMSTWTSTAGRARRSAPGGALPRPRASAKSKWLAGYGVAAVLPLAAVLIGSPPPGRGFALELASALGIVALTVLALQLVLPARLGVVARPLGAEVASASTVTWPTCWWQRSPPTWRWSWSTTPPTWRCSTPWARPGGPRRRLRRAPYWEGVRLSV